MSFLYILYYKNNQPGCQLPLQYAQAAHMKKYIVCCDVEQIVKPEWLKMVPMLVKISDKNGWIGAQAVIQLKYLYHLFQTTLDLPKPVLPPFPQRPDLSLPNPVPTTVPTIPTTSIPTSSIPPPVQPQPVTPPVTPQNVPSILTLPTTLPTTLPPPVTPPVTTPTSNPFNPTGTPNHQYQPSWHEQIQPLPKPDKDNPVPVTLPELIDPFANSTKAESSTSLTLTHTLAPSSFPTMSRSALPNRMNRKPMPRRLPVIPEVPTPNTFHNNMHETISTSTSLSTTVPTPTLVPDIPIHPRNTLVIPSTPVVNTSDMPVNTSDASSA